MSYRLIDWLRNSLTAKTTTIAGTEQIWIDDAGTSKKALLSDAIRYGGGSPRSATAGNATMTTDTTGALWLEVTGQTAGNARGAGAFDWQAVRGASDAAKVASGAGAIATGQLCTASGTRSVAIGTNCAATQTGAIAMGTACSATQVASVVMGIDNEAVGLGAVALAGRYASAANIGQVAFGSGHTTFWGFGAAQGCIQTLFRVTTDASATTLSTNNSATDRMVIPATRAITFTGLVTAMCNVSASSNFVKSWEIKGAITRDGSGTTRLVGTPTISVIAQDADGTPTPSTWAITSITADDTNESLAITVTGQAGTTIRFQASLFYSQVGY